MKGRFSLLVLVLWALGCGCRKEAQPEAEPPGPAAPSVTASETDAADQQQPDESAERSSPTAPDNTHGLPLVFEIDVPEVPARLLEPAGEIPED